MMFNADSARALMPKEKPLKNYLQDTIFPAIMYAARENFNSIEFPLKGNSIIDRNLKEIKKALKKEGYKVFVYNKNGYFQDPFVVLKISW